MLSTIEVRDPAHERLLELELTASGIGFLSRTSPKLEDSHPTCAKHKGSTKSLGQGSGIDVTFAGDVSVVRTSPHQG